MHNHEDRYVLGSSEKELERLDSICIKKKHTDKDKTNTISPSPLSSIDNNIDFVVGDIYNTEFEHSSFDFIYSRLLFQHLQYPSKAIKEMKRLASNNNNNNDDDKNNNGIICTEDIDHGLWLSHPHDLHLEKLRKCLVRLLELSGSDPYIARKIYKIFLQIDLKPTVDSYSVCIPMSKRPHNMMGVNMAETLKDKILANKLMSYENFDIMLLG